MKNVVKLFSIGIMIVLLLFNASLLFSQSNENNIKKGSVFTCNVAGPKQGAYCGTPVWVFANFNFIFEDGGKVFNCFETCMYTINTRNGGLGEAIVVKASDTKQDTYQVKDGNIYIWGSTDTEQIADSAYLILAIEDEEHLTPIKTTEDAFNSSHFVYLGNMKELDKMSDEAKDQVERKALNLLLSLRNQETYLERMERLRREEERKEKERRQREEEERRQRERARVKELETIYSPCQFLFDNYGSFFYCISSKNKSAIDNTIQQLISDKLNTVSDIVKNGPELYENYENKITIGKTMRDICNICNSNQISENIVNHTENELESFVSERKALTKAYNKAKKKDPNLKYSKFLISYINEAYR